MAAIFQTTISNAFSWIKNICISTEISLKFVSTGPINNIPSLVQIMAWRRPGDKPLSEQVIDYLLTHICVTRPQWVNIGWIRDVFQISNHICIISARLNSTEALCGWQFIYNLILMKYLCMIYKMTLYGLKRYQFCPVKYSYIFLTFLHCDCYWSVW